MEEQFSTKDIYLCSALIALGARYDSADRTDPRHIIFYLIPNGLDIDSAHTQWVNNELMVNAVSFKNALQQMKSVIHSG